MAPDPDPDPVTDLDPQFNAPFNVLLNVLIEALCSNDTLYFAALTLLQKVNEEGAQE